MNDRGWEGRFEIKLGGRGWWKFAAALQCLSGLYFILLLWIA